VIGKTVSHYRITGQVGAGGMGVVYAGEDTRLGRPVALKFVPEDLAKDRLAIERLHGEARTASGLNHPNICTIYDIGESDGQPFIVMELLKGQTLRDRLAASPLKIHESVELGIQVADALDAAHRHDIIHRDIKPANLFLVERGPVKILDFGLAKLISQTTPGATSTGSTRDRTAEGVTLGTISYMSPEQVTGEPLDGRTDLFSLGVVLYEAVTGHQPFTGKTSAVVFSAILTRAPVAPVVFQPEMPLRLQEIINNCLEKDRELRYQDSAGLRADLKRVRRDLESGHSGVFRIVGSVGGGTGTSPSGSRAQTTAAYADTTAPVPLPQAAAPAGRKPYIAFAAIVATALVAVASFWIWTHAQKKPLDSQPLVAATDAFVRERLGQATASLESRDYRGALAYADEVLRATPDERDATRIRDAARLALKRFDEAIAKTGELLAAGNTAAANAALAEARAIDPGAPAVADLSARLAGQARTSDSARHDAAAPRVAPAPPPSRQVASAPAVPDSRRPATAQPPTPSPPPATSPASQDAAPPRVASPVPETVAPPPAVPVPPAPARAAPPPEPSTPVVSAELPRAEAPAARREEVASPVRGAETDDDAIRRVVATYARAIETKDLALFRSVKPNLTPDEQRRIEDGFRAVTSQRVNVTILSIEHRGANALVRLRRRDTIDAAGRQQTSESVQTMTLTHAASGWVIQEIGR